MTLLFSSASRHHAASTTASVASVGGGSSRNSFNVVTYNILAKSLGTNTIPWVMSVSTPMQRRIEKVTNEPFKEWVNNALKPEYMTHFHKNFASGNYASMRQFWGIPRCESPKDIPTDLPGLEWVRENVIRYDSTTAKDAAAAAVGGGGGSPIMQEAKTLKGMIQQTLPTTLANDFFQEVSASEEQIYAWPVRGPRIFVTATQGVKEEGRREARPTTNNDNEPQNKNHQEQQESSLSCYFSADIIALQEYDCHSVFADYRSSGCSETFSDAMSKVGYDGIFFKDPLQGRDPPSGLGVFWKRTVFETSSPTTPPSPSPTGSSQNITGIHQTTLECNTEAFHGAVYNADLQEHWHPVVPPQKNENNNNNNTSTDLDPPTLMKAADRRNAAFCRLRHRSTGRTVAICAAHLMTTSRDNVKTNQFPGEVRAGELNALKALVENRTDKEDAVIVLGDFNTDAKVAQSLFTGQIPFQQQHAITTPMTTTTTTTNNNNREDNDGDNDKEDKQEQLLLHIDTGFKNRKFHWGGSDHVLEDAFHTIHQWGETVGENQSCTSRNAERIEWIDYMFYDPQKLQPNYISSCNTPNCSIPNQDYPSDHLPLFATFEFV